MAENTAIPEVTGNLEDLRSQSLKIVAAFTAIIAYVWLFFVVWPTVNEDTPPAAWIGSISLVLSVSLSYILGRRWVRQASAILIIGTLVAVLAATIASRLPDLVYLFIIPVILASVLVSPASTALTAVAAIGLIAGVSITILGSPLFSAHVVLSIGIAAAIMIISWLSAQNLYTTLEWVWQGYHQARQNEQKVRERSAELRRALKALDEASYRLERTTHTLALAQAQADEARRMKQQFAQTISHELRTPLNLIIGFTELMAQSPEYYGAPLPAAYVHDLSIVHRNARYLQNLVSDVLDLARIEAAQMGLVLEQVEPGALLTEAVNTARNLVESRGLLLVTEIEPGLPLLKVDPTRIRQVLFNLLNNAARFTEAGQITVRVRRVAETVVFAVADTGVGIAPADLPRVFHEFQQLDGGTRRRQGGAGLGLAISRGFVELHGGRIWVESELGRGSTFSFALPVQQLGQALTSLEQPAPTRSRQAARAENEAIVLAVTKSLSAGGLLMRYLRGVRVVAADLPQAGAAARELLPQVVVIDTASIPLEAGQLEAMMQGWNLSNAPFVACPLSGEEPLRLELAVDGYLIKPVSQGILWDLLRPFGAQVDNILLVDDDADFIRLMTRLLDNPVRRYEVRSALNGQEALDILHRWRPDLILVDLGLPDIDGRQVIEQIQAHPVWGQIPIIVVSGQEEMRSLRMRGSMMIGKQNGLLPGEVVQWLQDVVDSAIQTPSPRPRKARRTPVAAGDAPGSAERRLGSS